MSDMIGLMFKWSRKLAAIHYEDKAQVLEQIGTFWWDDGDMLWNALHNSGWRTITHEASYLWSMEDDYGNVLNYCEGDLS